MQILPYYQTSPLPTLPTWSMLDTRMANPMGIDRRVLLAITPPNKVCHSKFTHTQLYSFPHHKIPPSHATTYTSCSCSTKKDTTHSTQQLVPS